MTSKPTARKTRTRHVPSLKSDDRKTKHNTTRNHQPILVEIPYKTPYDWESMLSTFRSHQLPHLESVDDLGYERVIPAKKDLGWIRVTHNKDHSSLRVSIWNREKDDISDVNQTVRCMFDLDADPDVLRHAMTADPFIFNVWNRHPGLRVPRSWNGFETMLTTILGQVVSVSFGRTLADEMMKACGTKAVHPKSGELIHLFPTAKQLISGDLTGVRTSESRRVAIRSLAKLALDGTLTREHPLAPAELRAILLAIPGIGPWTAEYVAMRGFQDDDAFPATDYGLKQELKRHPEIDVDRVRPWRAYAATALWKSYAESKGKSSVSLV